MAILYTCLDERKIGSPPIWIESLRNGLPIEDLNIQKYIQIYNYIFLMCICMYYLHLYVNTYMYINVIIVRISKTRIAESLVQRKWIT